MKGLALNVLLAFVWALFAGEVSTRVIIIGFLLGFMVLAVFPRALGTHGYVLPVWAGLRFLGIFLRELTAANVQIALFALRRRPPLQPRIVAVPLRVQGDAAQTLLAATITLMPGTVAMGFSPDRRFLYAHAIGTSSPQAAIESVQRVEDRLLQVLSSSRPSPEVQR